MGARVGLRRLKATLGGIWKPRTLIVGFVLAAIIGGGAIIRFHFAAFLDPFEDGYQNWWISANLVSTGQYWDRHSMMTQGNWLPLYHFVGAGVLELAGQRSMAALKATNIVISSLTSLLVFLIARREGPTVGLAASAFFSFSFIDIVVSGWATAESLATFMVLLGYAGLFTFQDLGDKRYWVAGAALTLAALTRYEVWLIVGLLMPFLFLQKDAHRRMRLLAVTPAIAVMGAYFIYALQWGFLPSIVVAQTSTDIRYQIEVGTQPSVGNLLSRWWTGYLLMLPVVVLGGGSLLPPTIQFWTDGFASSQPMVPLEEAGLFVQSLPHDPSRILLSESPIAAYFSGYQPSEILGSRWLPNNRSAALSFLKASAQYVVYMGVPYYRLRILFPELQNGTNTPDFRLLYDAGGLQIGTHAVYVYQVVYSIPATRANQAGNHAP